MTPEDHDAVLALHEGVCAASHRFRFFTSGSRAGRDYVSHLFPPDGSPPVASPQALLALVGGQVVALATAEPLDTRTAEVSFLVSDDLRGHGVGTLLLEHLAAAARDGGVTRFVAEVLGDNLAMTRVFASAGFDSSRHVDGGVVEVQMSTAASARAVAAADDREARSQARSLAPLLHPHSVAPGVLVLAAPDTQPAGAVRAAADRGASVVVLLGHRDGWSDPEGGNEPSRRTLVRLARSSGVRVVGPRSDGVVLAREGTRLGASTDVAMPRPGGLAVATQSRSVGRAVLDAAVVSGLGVDVLVSLGDKADVSGNDLLAAWADDPQVTAAALCLDSWGNLPKLARFSRRFSERKPLLVLLPPAAGDASSSAVGHLALHSGLVVCHGIEELVQTAHVLAEQVAPRGPRILVVTPPTGTTGASLGAALTTSRADAVVVVVEDDPEGVGQLVATAVDVAGSRVPVVFVGTRPAEGGVGGTWLPTVEAATATLARIAVRSAWLSVPRADPPAEDVDRARTARRIAGELLDHRAGRASLDREESAALLRPYGLGATVTEACGPAAGCGSVEVGFGRVVDPLLGPVVTMSTSAGRPVVGGRVTLLLPVDAAAVARAVASVHGLAGDTAALTRLLLAVGALLAEVPEISQLDLGHLVSTTDGVVPGEVTLSLTARTTRPHPGDGVPRRLGPLR